VTVKEESSFDPEYLLMQKVVEILAAPALEPSPVPPAAVKLSASSHESGGAAVRPPLPSTSTGGSGVARRGVDLKEQIQRQMEKLKPPPVSSGEAARMDSPANPSDLRSVLNRAFQDRYVF